MKRPDNFNQLVEEAKNSRDFLGIMEQILGMELIQQRYRTKHGAIVYKTRVNDHLRSDYSSLAVFYNPGKGWQVLDHKGRFSGDAIEVVKNHYQMSYDEAVYFLAGKSVGQRAAHKDLLARRERTLVELKAAEEKAQPREEFKPLAISCGKKDTAHVRAYLGKTRGIPYPLIDQMMSRGILGQSPVNPYKYKVPCCVFNCLDQAGKIAGQIWRSTLSPEFVNESNAKFQKGNVPFGNNSVPWVFSYQVDPAHAKESLVFVCEAPIDAASLLAITGLPGHYVAMGGLNPGTLEYVKENIGSNVVLCVDNDAWGKRFCDRWISQHPEDQDKVILPELEEVAETERKKWESSAHGPKADWNQNLKYRIENGLPVALLQQADSAIDIAASTSIMAQ